MFRYYLKLRPVSPGTVPNGFVNYFNYNYRTYVVDVGWVWAWVEYDHALTKEEIHEYELAEMLL